MAPTVSLRVAVYAPITLLLQARIKIATSYSEAMVQTLWHLTQNRVEDHGVLFAFVCYLID